MDVPVPRQYRPTLIIFVGSSGEIITKGANTANATSQGQGTGSAPLLSKSVYEYFCELGALLDSVLYQSVGLLTIDEGSPDATERSRGKSPHSGHLCTLLDEVLHSIQGYRSILDIEDAGYPVYIKHPQVYIVGRIDSRWVSVVAKQVNTVLGDERSLALISYILLDEPASTHQATSLSPSQPSVTSVPSPSPHWTEDLLSQGDSMPLVNFCYLYEEMGQHLLYMEEADIRYAAAEALFGLVATGITAAAPFETATSLSLAITDSNARIGSMGTSLIRFPRAEVERYCIDMHGVELVHNWINAMHLNTEQQAALNLLMREQAQADAQQIGNNLSDDAPRPGFEERFWPSLTFLRNDSLHYQLKEATEHIFRPFLDCKQGSINSTNCETQALQALSLWKEIAKKVWREGSSALKREVSGKVDGIWIHNEHGIIAAQAYSSQLDIALRQLHDQFTNGSVSHQETYEEALHGLQELGNGPWTYQLTAANGQALPIQADSATQAQQQNQPSGIPNREREIIENLHMRAEWMHKRVPKFATLGAVSVMAIIPLVWLLLTLLSPVTPFLATLAVAVSAGLSGGGAWFYRYWTNHRARKAKEDLLRAYGLYFAYQCEQWEDTFRIDILDTMEQRVQDIQDLFNMFEKSLSSIAETLQDQAKQTEKDLFDGPSGYRDVFVGNKEILSRHSHSLADFNQTIVHLRQSFPKEEWHQAPDKMHRRLRESFAEQGINIIGMRQGKLITHIRSFIQTMVAPYLQGERVEVASALKAEGVRGKRIVEKALDNAQVLYRPYQNIPLLNYYICGGDEQRDALPEIAIPPNTTMVCTADRDWLLLTCFWTGGARTRWSARMNTQNQSSPTVASGLPSAPTWS